MLNIFHDFRPNKNLLALSAITALGSASLLLYNRGFDDEISIFENTRNSFKICAQTAGLFTALNTSYYFFGYKLRNWTSSLANIKTNQIISPFAVSVALTLSFEIYAAASLFCLLKHMSPNNSLSDVKSHFLSMASVLAVSFISGCYKYHTERNNLLAADTRAVDIYTQGKFFHKIVSQSSAARSA